MNWTASWIFTDNKCMENRYMMARRSFDLDKIPEEANIIITADKCYRLFVNGNHVCRGPIRSGLNYRYYDIVDIASYLKEGKNTIAVIVWYYNIAAYEHMKGCPGFLCQGDIQGVCIDTGKEGWLVKDADAWCPHPTRFSVCLPFAEYVDLNKIPDGWNETDFDDSSFIKPYVIGIPPVEPWEIMKPRDIPFMLDEIDDTKINLLSSHTINTAPVCYTLDIMLTLGWYPLMPKEAFLTSYIKAAEKTDITLHLIHVGSLDVYLNNKHIEFSESQYGWGFKAAKLSLDAGVNTLTLRNKKEGYFWFIHYCFETDEKLLFSGDNQNYSEALSEWSVSGPYEGKEANESFANLKSISAKKIPARLNPAIRVTIEPFKTSLDVTSAFPVELPSQADDYQVIYDFGGVVTGYPVFDFISETGLETIDISFSEMLYDNRVLPAPYGSLNFSDQIKLKKGKNHFESNFLYKGFRYLCLTIRNSKNKLALENLKLRRYRYPLEINSKFTSSDPMLDKIWNIGIYTLMCCMSDAYMDCPSREQAFYTGDLTAELLTNLYVSRDARLAASNLRFVPLNQYDSGFFCAVFPRRDGDESDVLLDQNMDIITNTLNYVMFTGDLSVALDIDNALEKLIKACDKFISDKGLLENVTKPIWIDHLLWDIYSNGIQSAINMRYYKVLMDYSKLSQLINKNERAAILAQNAEKLKNAINKYLKGSDNVLYIDGIDDAGNKLEKISIQVNSMAVAYDIAPKENIKAIADFIFSNPDKVIQTKNPFFYYYINQMLFKADKAQLALDIMRDKWGEFIEAGYDTWPETWGEWYVSYCHAYSSTPNIAIASNIMGINPVEPGYKKAVISPLFDLLESTSIEVPTPNGSISVKCNSKTDYTNIEIIIPNGCKADFENYRTFKKTSLETGLNTLRITK